MNLSKMDLSMTSRASFEVILTLSPCLYRINMNDVVNMLLGYTDIGMKRLYKFVIKRVLRDIVEGDIDLSMLDISLLQGTLNLKDLRLNSSFINETLSDLLPSSGVYVHSGSIHSLSVVISYKDILNESVSISINGLTLNIISSSNKSKTKEKDEKKTEVKESPPSTASIVDEPYSIREGLDVLAAWIDVITQKIKINMSNVKLIVKGNPHPDDKTCTPFIEMNLETLLYFDETPIDSGRFEPGSTSVSKPVSMIGMLLHKRLVFKGLSIYVGKHIEETDQNSIAKTCIGVLESHFENSIKIILANNSSTEAPKIDIDIFVNSIKTYLSPSEVELILLITESFNKGVIKEIPAKNTFLTTAASSIANLASGSVSQGPWMHLKEGEDVKTSLTLRDFERIDSMLRNYATAYMSGRPNKSSVNLDNSLSSLSSTEYFDTMEDSFGESRRSSRKSESELIMKFHFREVKLSLFPIEIIPTLVHNDSNRLEICFEDCIAKCSAIMSLNLSISLTLGSISISELFEGAGNSVLRVDKGTKPIAASCKIDRNTFKMDDLGNQIGSELRINFSSEPVVLTWDMDYVHRWKPFIEVLSAPPVLKADKVESLTEVEAENKSVTDRIISDVSKWKEQKIKKKDNQTFSLSFSFNSPSVIMKVLVHNSAFISSKSRILDDYIQFQLNDVSATSAFIESTKKRNDRPGLCDWTIEFTTGTVSLESTRNLTSVVLLKIQRSLEHDIKTTVLNEALPRITIRIGNGHFNSLLLSNRDSHKPKLNRFYESSKKYAPVAGSPIEEVEEDSGDEIVPKSLSDKNLENVAFEIKAIESSLFSVFITLPVVLLEISKVNFDRMMELVIYMSTYSPPGTTTSVQTSLNIPSGLSAFAAIVKVENFNITLKESIGDFILDFYNIKVFQVTNLLATRENHIHASVADMSFFEVPINTLTGKQESRLPLLYRCKWGSNFQVENDVIPDMINVQMIFKDAGSFTEVTSNIDVFSLLFRYSTDLDKTIDRLQTFMDFTRRIHEPENKQSKSNQVENNNKHAVINKLFLHLYDTSVEYVHSQAPVRTDKIMNPEIIINVGFLNFSTNLVSTGTQLGFKIELRDLALYLSSCAQPFDVTEAACGWIYKRVKAGKHSWTGIEDHLAVNGFVNVLRGDILNIFLRLYLNDMTLRQERIEVEVDGTEIMLLACYDSLALFGQVVSEWAEVVIPKKVERPDVIIQSTHYGDISSLKESKMWKNDEFLHKDTHKAPLKLSEVAREKASEEVHHEADDQLTAAELRALHGSRPINFDNLVIEDYYTPTVSKTEGKSIESKGGEASSAIPSDPVAHWLVKNDVTETNVEGEWTDFKVGFKDPVNLNALRADAVNSNSEISDPSLEARERSLFGSVDSNSVLQNKDNNSSGNGILHVPALSSDDEDDDDSVGDNELFKSVHQSSINTSSKFWFPVGEVDNKRLPENELNSINRGLIDETSFKPSMEHSDAVIENVIEEGNESEDESKELEVFKNGIDKMNKSLFWESSASVEDTLEFDLDNNDTTRSCLLNVLQDNEQHLENSDEREEIEIKPLHLEESIMPASKMSSSFFSLGIKGESSRWYDGPASVHIYPYYIGIPSETDNSGPFPDVVDSETGNKKEKVEFRLLVNDVKIKCRLFGGRDFSLVVGNKGSGVDDNKSNEKQEVVKQKKNVNLLDALLENYAVDPEGPENIPKNKSKSNKGPLPSTINGGRENIIRMPIKKTKSVRDTSNMIEINLLGVSAIVESFENKNSDNELNPYSSKIIVKAKNIEVFDQIMSSDIKRIVGYWKDEEEHPREAGSSMLQLVLDVVRIPESRAVFAGEEEYRLTLSLLPLRVIIGQGLISFLTKFVKDMESLDVKQTVVESISDIRTLPPYFSMVDVKSIKVKFDFAPKALDINGLKNGDLMELLNIFPIDGMYIRLRRVTLYGLRGVGPIIEGMLTSYIEDITSKQLHNVVASIGAFRPLANLSSGVADLVLLPMSQYKRDGRIVHGLKRGTGKLLKIVTVETLGIASKLTRAARDVLSLADPHAGVQTSSTPLSAREGVSQAYDSLSKGMRAAGQTVIAIPVEEFYKEGASGAIKSVVRAVPIAVLRPMIGATDALNRAMTGIRNEVDHDMRDDDLNKWKS